MLFRTIALAILLFASVSSFGQQPVSISYNSSNGLISNETYDVICDSKGYIWVATELGVSRYNGYEFENFDVNDGLPDQVILSVQEDARGRIWFTSFSGSIAYYDGGKIHPYKYNDIILERTTSKKYPPKIFCTGNDSLYVNLFGIGHFLINPDGTIVEEIPQIQSDIYFRHSYDLKIIENKLHETLIRYPKKEERDSVHVFWKNKQYRIPVYRSPYIMLTAEYAPNQSIFITFHDYIAEIDSAGTFIERYFPHNMTESQRLRNGQHVMGTVNDGLYIYNDIDDLDPTFHLIENKRITGIAEDQSGGIWVSTLNSGIFYIPNNGLLIYQNKDEEKKVKVSALMCHDEGLILGYENGSIQQLNPETANWREIKPEDGERIYDLTFFKDSIFCVSNNKIRSLSLNGTVSREQRAVGKCASVSGDSVLFVGGLALFQFNKTSFEMRRVEGRIEYMAPFHEGKFFAGNGWGLWELDFSNDPISTNKTDITAPISGLEQWRDILIVCTKGEGIYLLREDKSKQLSRDNQLSSNNIRAVELYQDQLWVVHEKGIDVLKLNSENLEANKLIALEKNRDLPATNVTSILIDNERVWLGTEDDLYSISHDYKSDASIYPIPFIRTVHLNDSIISPSAVFSSDFNNFTGEFLSIDFQSHGEQTYRYRLIGLDTNWQTTKSRTINYGGLPAGQYNLEVQAQQGLYGWSKSAIGPTFTIKTPLFERTWFIWLVFILVTSAIYLMILATYVTRNRRKARKVQNKVNLLDLKLKALQAQMNPHFTFNTLNSIQYYILENDSIKAAEYLTKFSTLIRKFLDHSRANFISIHDELNTIKEYLDLENIRLNDQFTYDIQVDDGLNTLQVEIPSAVIQPFVENAIWHGIAPKKTKGHIKIKIIGLPKGGIKCIIEDDGVGRSHKSKTTKSKHKSLGTRISQERIDLLKELYEQDFSIEFEDLYTESGEPSGTRVCIIFFKSRE